ncbi:MAG: formylglycine-generating enzyme family protein [Nitrospinae bacterium]|nr:formylglycine-generating enzyme family protein [Nitrospinota bacterium]
MQDDKSVSDSVRKKILTVVLTLTLTLPIVVNAEEGKDAEAPIEMVFVKGGCFQMGNPFGDGENDEVPVHEVCVNDFYIGKYEVTVEEFGKFVKETGYSTDAEKMGGCFGKVGYKWRKRKDFNWSKVDFPQTDRHPAVCISYNDANEFMNWLNKKFVVSETNSSGGKYRLPTEAEWEYAARSGGKAEKWAGTNNESEVSDYVWYDKNSGGKTHPVGQKKPNGLGLYDMSGNVWEWVEDWYEVDYYDKTPKTNPLNAKPSHAKSMRSGPWSVPLHAVRVFYRGSDIPYSICDGLGFRVAKTP